MKKRLFIAINLEESVLQELEKIIHILKENNAGAHIKWVLTKNLHITLQFLGDVEETLIPQINTTINKAFRKLPLINYQLGELSGFPNLNRPKNVYISIISPEIIKITGSNRILGQKLVDLSLEVDKRPWKAHITVGRVKDVNKHKIDLICQIKPLKGQVKTVDLMQSELTKSGPIYTIIASHKLSP